MQDLDTPRARIRADLRTRYRDADADVSQSQSTSGDSDDELTSSSDDDGRVVMETDEVKLESVRRYQGDEGYQLQNEDCEDDERSSESGVEEVDGESRDRDDEEMERFDNVS